MSDRRAEREAEKQRRDRRGLAIAAISTVVVLGGITALIVTSPGWPLVRDVVLHRGGLHRHVPGRSRGLLARRSRVRDRRGRRPDTRPACRSGPPGGRHLPCFRCVCWRSSTSTSSVASRRSSSCTWSASGSPRWPSPRRTGARRCGWLPTEPVILGGIALTLSYGAYVAEVYRAGINSIHRGQRDAALAVGLDGGANRCATSSFPRPCAGSGRPCSTTSSHCRRTWR